MRTLRLLVILIPVMLLLAVSGLAQDQEQLLVVFIEDNRIQTADYTDIGPDGLSRLAQIFQSMGARTQYIRFIDPFPEETDVIVMVRPRRALSATYLARLWLQMAQGKNLLLAIDPVGPAQASPDNARSGFARLLSIDFGLVLQEGILMQPWSTRDSVNELRTSFLTAYPDPLVDPHPVIQPLLDYDLQVQTWGARPLRVEPFGIDSFASALIYANAEYAEADPRVFAVRDPQPIGINIGVDPVGRMTLGGLAENISLGTRVAVLTDGEMLQNDFGLAYVPGLGEVPLHPGNTLLARRIAAWLLELPEEEWTSQLRGFTWVSIDGSKADWDATLPVATDAASDVSVLPMDIEQVTAFRDSAYLHLFVETASAPGDDSLLELDVDIDGDGEARTKLFAQMGQIRMRTADEAEYDVPDAEMAVGAEGIELRIPLREVGIEGEIPALCLSSGRDLAFPPPPDCLDQPLTIRTLQLRAPSTLRMSNSIQATVNTRDFANVREGPNTSYNVVTSLRNGEPLLLIGRTEVGDWIKVQNAQFNGWMADFLLTPNGDLSTLPVIEE